LNKINHKYKNQHYVPKFLLRKFSSNNKTINIFNTEKFEFYKDGKIKYQCCENNFYTNNIDLEKKISSLEDEVSKIFLKIIKLNNLGCLSRKEECLLLNYITFQYTRTKYEKEKSEEFDNLRFREWVKAEVHKEYGKELSEDDEKYINNLSLNNAGGHYLKMINGLISGVLIDDLSIILLNNNTKHNFIYSDAPIILHNNFLGEFGTRGFQTNGLQIFIPLTSKKLLMLYDGDCYNIDFLKVLNITSDDVDNLNLLQFLYCNKLIYFEDFSEKKHYELLFEKFRTVKKELKPRIKEVQLIKDNKIIDLTEFSENNVNYSLKLSFCKEVQKEKILK
jgi:hypothetical protein